MPEKSYYRSFRLIDLTPDSTLVGRLQLGGKLVDLVAEQPLDSQLSQSFSYLIKDIRPADGELVLLLKYLNFAEALGNSQIGFFEMAGVLFGGVNGLYEKITTIDTSIVVRGWDISKKVVRVGSNYLHQIIADNLDSRIIRDMSLKLEELPIYDSLEKAKLPLYKLSHLNDGLYYRYESFAMQYPDRIDFKATFTKKGQPLNILIRNLKGKMTQVKRSRDIYAMVIRGIAFVAGPSGKFYPIDKKGHSFSFKGRVSDVNENDVFWASFFFGIIGYAAAISNTSWVELELDYETGKFKTIKKID